MDKIRALRYFKRVAEVNSFSIAAEEFDVPPSSISRRIKDLEHELGVELLKRSTRNVSITELGSVYYHSITKALQIIDDADTLVSLRQGKMEGKLRISSTASYGEKILFPVLQRFQQQYPDITLELDYSEERLVLGKDPVDIAIRAGYMPEERVIAKHLSSDSFKLVSTPQLLSTLQQRFEKETLAISDIEASPVLQYQVHQNPLSWWSYDGQHWHELNLKPFLLCNSGESLLATTLAHGGLSLFPLWWIKTELASGELVEVPTELPISNQRQRQLDIFILYQQSKYQIPKIKRCVDFILQQLANR